MTRRNAMRALVLLVSFVLLAAGCGGSDGGDAGENGAGQPDQVKFLLAFVHDMVAVQYYFADDFGYFEQCGIDVEYQTAADVENPGQLILAGAVDIGILDP